MITTPKGLEKREQVKSHNQAQPPTDADAPITNPRHNPETCDGTTRNSAMTIHVAITEPSTAEGTANNNGAPTPNSASK
jgi:hypothetical protein